MDVCTVKSKRSDGIEGRCLLMIWSCGLLLWSTTEFSLLLLQVRNTKARPGRWGRRWEKRARRESAAYNWRLSGDVMDRHRLINRRRPALIQFVCGSGFCATSGLLIVTTDGRMKSTGRDANRTCRARSTSRQIARQVTVLDEQEGACARRIRWRIQIRSNFDIQEWLAVRSSVRLGSRHRYTAHYWPR